MTTQPSTEITVTRPWHWGIAILVATDGDVPDVDPDVLVSAGRSGAVICVRHAQDGVPSFDDEWEWATATVHLALLDEMRPSIHEVVADIVLTTAEGRFSLGDADEDVVVPTHEGRTRVLVEVSDSGDLSPDEVWIDLVPAE